MIVERKGRYGVRVTDRGKQVWLGTYRTLRPPHNARGVPSNVVAFPGGKGPS